MEFDGYYWHSLGKSSDKEAAKYNACKTKGIWLIRVRDRLDPNRSIADDCIRYDLSKDKNDLNNAISLLLELLGCHADIDVKRDEIKIKEQYYGVLKDRSLQLSNPMIAKEWNYSRNGKLTPDMVFKSSSDVVWWKCPNCGNEYRMRVNMRVGLGVGYCRKCSDKVGKGHSRPVIQMNLDGEVLARYDSIIEAKQITGAGSISLACSGKIKSSGGFIWKYDTDF